MATLFVNGLIAGYGIAIPVLRLLPRRLSLLAGADRRAPRPGAAAKQMETLAPMLALAAEFVGLGVTFERPITNYEILWQI